MGRLPGGRTQGFLVTEPDACPWFESSHSADGGTACVECAHAGDCTLVRDSKRAYGPVIAVRGSAWGAFLGALARGELEGFWWRASAAVSLCPRLQP
ncbi:DUF397 domain-containing protein [Streptomyces sp. NPDC050625]|uniref:DUF397 domain-containing protein n=1 Tax=Streptomyces sp. NPDC050625 TaxID=3154629 RepID=UPI0034302CC6